MIQRMGKVMSPPGGRIVLEVNTERDTGLVEDVDGVVGDEVSNASINKETGVVDEGGDPTGDGTTTGMVLDLDGESSLGDKEGRLKGSGV
jgi:hypothetical protein